jgi:hypothetical protein
MRRSINYQTKGNVMAGDHGARNRADELELALRRLLAQR